MSLEEIEQHRTELVRLGGGLPGAPSDVAAKEVGGWLYGACVETVLVTEGGVSTWRYYQVVSRDQAAADSVRAALQLTLVPHRYTDTRPHDRQIRDTARRVYGIELTDTEIQQALRAVMPS